MKSIAKIVDDAFRRFYEPGDEIPVISMESEHVDYQQEGTPPQDILSELMEADSEIVEAVIGFLSSSEAYDVIKGGSLPYYDISSNYIEASLSTHEHFKVWWEFRERIKHSRRFYDSETEELLGAIFKEIGTFKFGGVPPPIMIIDPKIEPLTVYRARRAATREDVHRMLENPATELGPPQASIARAGRMNAVGISVFYGAFNVDTCIAELRPPVGSYVLCASFTLQNKVKLLDLTVFETRPKFPSIFDEESYPNITRWKFLQSFHRQIIRPVQPEEEQIEYVPTQAVAEYVCNVMKYDGIVYSSAQADMKGKNVVLFNTHVIIAEKGNAPRSLVEDTDMRASHFKPWPSINGRPLLKCIDDAVEVVRITKADYEWESVMDEDELLS